MSDFITYHRWVTQWSAILFFNHLIFFELIDYISEVMANHMEQFQDEISKILDDFLEIMKTSTCHIEYSSYKENSYCHVIIKLWKMLSCRKHLLETAFFVKRRADLSHLARFLDSVANVFKFFHPQDENDSNWNWNIETVSKECALLLKFIDLVWNYSVSNREFKLRMYIANKGFCC